jgi:hypothetical protein
MGVKSNYFRHSFNAHSDTKIRQLIHKKGPLGYAVYFVLIELYCAKLFDDDERKEVQEFDLKLIGSYLKVRSDSVHSCLIVLSELQLIGHLSLKFDQTMIKLSIPKALKYFGKYEKVRDEICPNKSKVKEIKEKEIYKKKKQPKKVFQNTELENTTPCVIPSPLKALFPDDLEIQKWLETGSNKIHTRIFEIYDEKFLVDEIEKAYYWQLENKKRKAGSFLQLWLDRSGSKKLKSDAERELDLAAKRFIDTYFPGAILA